MFEEIKRHAKASLFRDPKTGIVYTEFRGSFSWPRGKDAFICVIGEEDRNARLHVVYERREKSIVNMAKRLMALQRLADIDWTADIEGKNKNLFDTLYEITYSEEDEEQVIYASQTKLMRDDFETALQILGREFQDNNLFLIHDGILFNVLKEIKQKDTAESGMAEKYPEVMILASIVFGFPPHERRLERYLPRDGYPEFFEDDDYSGSWMGM